MKITMILRNKRTTELGVIWLQSLTLSIFSFSRAFTVRLPCVQVLQTVRLLAHFDRLRLCSPFIGQLPYIHCALTLRSPFVLITLIVRFVSIHFYLERQNDMIALCEKNEIKRFNLQKKTQQQTNKNKTCRSWKWCRGPCDSWGQTGG